MHSSRIKRLSGDYISVRVPETMAIATDLPSLTGTLDKAIVSVGEGVSLDEFTECVEEWSYPVGDTPLLKNKVVLQGPLGSEAEGYERLVESFAPATEIFMCRWERVIDLGVTRVAVSIFDHLPADVFITCWSGLVESIEVEAGG